jgi:hypothetical protein
VDEDPGGAVTSLSTDVYGGPALVWTPQADRDFGTTHTARLAAGDISFVSHQVQPVVPLDEESTFEFSYIEGTSAEFLATLELAVEYSSATYTAIGAGCGQVVPSRCDGGSAWFQCWKVSGRMVAGGVWDGPGLPYLTLSTRPAAGSDLLPNDGPSELFELTERGEHCIEGTATGAGESTTLTACGPQPDPPVYDGAPGLETVFADSCQVVPPDAHALTLLVAARGKTEAEARELLQQANTKAPEPAPADLSEFDVSSDHEVLSKCAAAPSAPVAPASLLVAALACMGAVTRRRQLGGVHCTPEFVAGHVANSTPVALMPAVSPDRCCGSRMLSNLGDSSGARDEAGAEPFTALPETQGRLGIGVDAT